MKLIYRRAFASWHIAFGLLIASILPVSAQNAVILWVDDPVEVVVSPAEDEYALVDIGDRIPAGSTIETAETSIELQLEPSGAIVYISPFTLFTLDAIDVGPETVNHRFSLEQGKMRMVVSAFLGDNYEVETPSAVLGVRGTDFTQVVDRDEADWVCVREGEVTFRRRRDSRVVSVVSGAFADARDRRLVARSISRERLEQIFSDVQFRRPNPDAIRNLRERIPEIRVRDTLEEIGGRIDDAGERLEEGVTERLEGAADRLDEAAERIDDAADRTRERFERGDRDDRSDSGGGRDSGGRSSGGRRRN